MNIQKCSVKLFFQVLNSFIFYLLVGTTSFILKKKYSFYEILEVFKKAEKNIFLGADISLVMILKALGKNHTSWIVLNFLKIHSDALVVSKIHGL